MAAMLLAWAAPTGANAQKTSEFTVADANSLFKKMYGTHRVKTMIWQPEKQQFFEAAGSVRYSRNDNNTLREEFAIEQPDGTVLRYEGMLRYDVAKQQFESVQYDAAGNATIILQGKWDPNFAMIQLEPMKRQWKLNGKKRKQDTGLYLQYFFFDDGTFKKVLRSPEDAGDTSIAYEYHCVQHNIATR